jgi:hypothetical protein
MCWNQSVSLNTFIFGLFAVAFAFANNVITSLSAAGIMSFISMQLVEYFAWGNLKNKDIISFLSKIGLLLIFIQPIIIHEEPLPTNLFYPFIGFYIAFLAIVFTIFHPIQNINFTMHKASNGHLAWDWLEVPHIVAFIWFGFLGFPLLYNQNYIPLLLLLITFIACYILYIKTSTWGSMWCWIANGLSVFLIARVFAKELC